MGSINVNWNQWCPEVTSDYWELRNPEYNTITFDNGVATRTITTIPDVLYKSSIRIKSTIQWYSDHLYYFKQELFPSKTSKYYVIFGNNRDTASIINCPQDEWTFIRDIKYASATGMSRIYLTYTFDLDEIEVGDICKVRNPILVDLTQMYGAGNEPLTVEEFEHQCKINGINLNEYQPYTTGVVKSWRISGDGTLSTATTSGNIASFWSPTRADIKSCKVYFSPVQEGSGDPSPDNIRNISGWNGININMYNKNLYSYRYKKLSFTYLSGAYLQDYLPPGTYTFSAVVTSSDTDSNLCSVRFMDDTHNIEYGSLKLPRSVNGARVSQTFTLSNKSKFMYLYASNSAPNSKDDTVSFSDMQIEINSIATEYEDCKDTTTLISWESEIGILYGGYVDLVSGKLVANMVMNIYDGSSDEIWGINQTDNSYNFYIMQNNISPTPKKRQYRNESIATSNMGYPGLSSQGAISGTVTISWNGSLNANLGAQIGISTIEEWRTYLSSHNLQVAYELETPITYQLTPQQLTSFIGRNNILSNADNIEVTYNLYESADITLAKKKIYLSSPHIESKSGSVATFDTDMKAPLKECKLHFLPIQEGSGDPSPDNVRPITGWTGFNAYQIKSDVLNITYRTGDSESYNVKFNVDSYGKITANGTPTSYSSRVFADIAVEGTEILRGRICGNLNNITSNGTPIYDNNWNRIASASDPALLNGINLSNYEGAKYAACAIKRNIDSTPMFGSCFVAFTKDGTVPDLNTIPITFPSEAGTVYGGYVDLINGELVQEWKSILIKDLTWISYHQYSPNVIRTKVNDIARPSKGPGYNIMSDSYKAITGSQAGSAWDNKEDNSISIYYPSDDLRIAIKDSRFSTDVSNFVSVMGNTRIVYKLAVPITYQLTPQQIKTLIGRNNIWSDAGDIEIKYWTH